MTLDTPLFYHRTKVNLKIGDLIEPGFNSNYGRRKKAAYVYFTATLDAATWGAELAIGEGKGRIYRVEPTGTFELEKVCTFFSYQYCVPTELKIRILFLMRSTCSPK